MSKIFKIYYLNGRGYECDEYPATFYRINIRLDSGVEVCELEDDEIIAYYNNQNLVKLRVIES